PAMAGSSLESNRFWRLFVNAAPVDIGVNGPAAGGILDSYLFTAGVNLTATLPITYFWQATAQPPAIATGGPSNTTAFTWTMPGQMLITVTASNPGGAITATTAITIDEAIAGLAAANNGPSGLGAATMLSATTTSGTNVSYEWDFGDGSKGADSPVSHAYARVATYTATVTATNGAGSETASTVVTIVDEAIAGLSAANDGPTSLGDATTLSAAISSGTNVTYEWDFDDGSFGGGPAVSHTYSETGVYTATVTASNPVNMIATTTTVTIEPGIWQVYLPVALAAAQSCLSC
ncbi:MAG: PKD domain-containing protein, partial [Chloroflexota bacterium]